MADQLPAVPQITDTVTPGGATMLPAQAALDQQITQLGAIANSKLPTQYTQGYAQQAPKLPTVTQFQPKNDHQAPIGGGSAMLKAQDTRNSIASLSNMIGKAGQAIAQKKQDNLKADLTTVMQAKTNAENAMAVLKQDPNNKMAQGVLAANKKRLNDILSDPKKQKQLAKALDLSYTDPDSNKTPEIAAGQQAIAAVKQAGPYNANNPAEAKIAQQAQQGAKPQQQSATPRADQAIGRDLPTIENNPQYTQALAQRQAAQKSLETLLPKALESQTQLALRDMQEKGSNARANLDAQMVPYKEHLQNIDKLAQIDAAGKTAIKIETMKAQSAMATTMARVNGAMKLMQNKSLDPANRLKIQTETMATIDRSIAGKVQNNAQLAAQMANPNATDAQKQLIQAQMDTNNVDLQQTQAYRQQVAKGMYGITGQVPTAPVQDGKQPQGQGWFSKFTDSKAANVLGGSAGATGTGVANAAAGSGVSATTEQSRPNIQVVGRDASDESSSDSGDSDSDFFGNEANSIINDDTN